MSSKRCGMLLILLWCLLATTVAWAQETKGTLAGIARDASGGVVPGVTITVRNTATGFERSVVTQPNGGFRIPALPFGAYDLKAELQGFTTVTIGSIGLGVDQVRTVDIVMQVGNAAETVNVVGRVDLVDTQTSKIGEIIDNTKVLALPLNGRNFTQLGLLSPGVAASGGGGAQQGGEGGVTSFSSNGQRGTSNNFLVDGIDNNNYVAGAVAQLPSIDSIQEFEIQTNTFAAEYGRGSGAVVNLVTRSGTNDLHASAFEFLRHDALDARNYFDNPEFAKPITRLNQFGGTAGGPLVKDRTFFFFSYEGFRRRVGITRLTNVPTAEDRLGIFTTPDGQKVQVNLNPVSARLFQLFPQPNVSSRSGNFVSSPTLVQDYDQLLLKIDHRIRGYDALSARYTYNPSSLTSPFTPGQGGTPIPGFGIQTSGGNHLLAASYTKIIGSGSLNEFRFGLNRSTSLNVNEPGPQAADYGINTGWPANAPLSLGNIPNITFSGGLVSGGGRIANLGGSINNPGSANQNVFQFSDQFSWATARHAWKFGGDVRHVQLNRRYDLAFSGQIIFDGSQNSLGIANPLIDFAEGKPSASLQFVGDSVRELRTTAYAFFAQDSFRIRPNLTINYGVRYELNTVLHDTQGRLSTFRPELFQHYLSPSADQTNAATLRESGVVSQAEAGGIYKPDHNNLAPRVGVAYTLGTKAKTVIRAGYGIYYDTIMGNIPGNVMLNPPFLPDYYNTAPFIQFPNSFGPTAFPVLTVTTEDYRTPYAQHYNVDVQRELPGKILLELGYVGSRGTNLPRFRQINQAFITQAEIDKLTPSITDRLLLMGIPPPAVAFLSTRINLMPPISRNTYFGFAQIFTAENTVESRYDSLQVKLNKQYSHGLSFLLSYTLSKSMDTGSVFYGSAANGTTIFPQDNFNAVEGERGLSDFDTRHRLVFSYVYELPSLRKLMGGLPAAIADGWQVGGILTLQSGQPFSVLTGLNNSTTGLGNDRPNLIGDPNAGPKTVDQWFDTSAFQVNQLLTFGNSGRNIVIGPPYRNFDLALMKNNRIGKRVTAQFRVECFNLTNTPHFAIPSNVMGSPNFGTLYQTLDVAQNNVGLGSGGPRLIQVGLKLIY